MAIKDTHPEYSAALPLWTQMLHTFKGQAAVKEQGAQYLPVTAGMLADGYPQPASVGGKAYAAYKTRAVFHEFVNDAASGLVGIMHRKPPTIELPTALEVMMDNATSDEESLGLLLAKINLAQIVYGRHGLLLDAPDGETGKGAIPYIATYQASTITNWGYSRIGRKLKLNAVVLNESGAEQMDDLSWQERARYRLLRMVDGGVYATAEIMDDMTIAAAEPIVPQIAGQSLDRIPFVFVNVTDLIGTPDIPPLLSLSNISLAIYRLEADYRQSLFMQGQDTGVRIGANDDDTAGATPLGAGALMDLPIGADFKFVGVSGQGLSEMRQALENDKSDARQKSMALLDGRSKAKESGEALGIRMAARTATLTNMAKAGAAGLENILRIAAEWVGANPADVLVKPNLDFVDDPHAFKDLDDLMNAKLKGLPISEESIHEWLQRHDFTGETYEEERARLDAEAMEAGGSLPLPPPAGGAGAV